MATYRFHAQSLALIAVALLVLRWIYWQITVGVKRRRMIREYGCLPTRHYPHKGLLGKLFGYDTLKENLKWGAKGQLLEVNRKRNFADGNTIKVRVLYRTCTLSLSETNSSWLNRVCSCRHHRTRKCQNNTQHEVSEFRTRQDQERHIVTHLRTWHFHFGW